MGKTIGVVVAAFAVGAVGLTVLSPWLGAATEAVALLSVGAGLVFASRLLANRKPARAPSAPLRRELRVGS